MDDIRNERVNNLDCLHWDVTVKDPEGFIHFMEKSVSFLHIYFGDVREAVAHSEKIGKYGRVIYNEAAWDTDRFEKLKEEIICPNHYEVVKEVILRIEKYKCKKIDMGFVGRWKNPYQIADTHLPTGITITYEVGNDDVLSLHGSLFKPDHWFDLQCKPLFKTDALVEKEPNGSWNMNQAGLIASKPEKCAANRRALFNMLTAFFKEYSPLFMGLSKSNLYYNHKNNTAYLEDPQALEDEELLPLFYTFQEQGKVLQSDSSSIESGRYGQTMVNDYRINYDKKHFDFI